MKAKIIFLFLISQLFGFVLYAQNINTNKLDSLFDILSLNNKAMCSVAISKNGANIYKRSIGYSTIDNKEKLLANELTQYHIGSITKMFTAVIVFQLIEENKLSLDAKLSTFFPEIPNSKLISIKELLNHRNGLYDFVNDSKDELWLNKPRSEVEILDAIKKGKTHFKPDSKLEYSNTGYLLLTYIIEKITHQTYRELVQDRICNKIGLKNTFTSTPNDSQKKYAKSYGFDHDWIEIPESYYPNVKGVGDIVSTPLELITFNEALLNGKLISNQSLEYMKTIGDGGFGMGIIKIPFGKKYAFGHGGDTHGTHSIVGTFVNEKISMALCDNGEVYPHNDISIAILSICFIENYQLPNFKSIEYKAEELDKYLGVYSSKQIPLKIAITKNGTTLIAQATGQASFSLESTIRDEFKFDQAGIIIDFIINKNELILKQNGGIYLFTKDN